MNYLLDTDTCVEILRNNTKVVHKVRQIPPSEIGISIITLCELRYGSIKGGRASTIEKTNNFAAYVSIVSLEGSIADDYADIRVCLERSGNIIGANDLLIAAHARYLDLILVTNNLREYNRVPGLRVETWI